MLFSLLQVGPQIALAFILALVVGITVHEFSHALAGFLMGDMTAKDAGRLTLNPAAHLDLFGSIMLLLAGFGWGKPTPYNPYNLRYQKWGPLLVAIAGPISNAVVVIVSVICFEIFLPILGGANMLVIFLRALISVNLMLAVFNLIPIPPLDGSQILFAVLPHRFDNIKYFLLQNGPYVLLMIIIADNFLNLGIFSHIFGFFRNFLPWF